MTFFFIGGKLLGSIKPKANFDFDVFIVPYEGKETTEMGYMGLDIWESVDGASDLLYFLGNYKGTTKFLESIDEAIAEEGNAFNPPGCVNLALLLEAKQVSPNELGRQRLSELLDKMVSLIEQAHDDYHDQAYVRLYGVVRRCLKRIK